MTKRMIALLGGVLVVGTLALGSLGASMASGDPAPTAEAAGTGGGCYDHYPPYSRWGHDWWNHDGSGRHWHGWTDGDSYFGGRAWDRGCGAYGAGKRAGAATGGHLSHVMVAVKRLRGSRCQSVYRSGRLGSLGSCGHTHWMRAHGGSTWRLPIPRPLPIGRYRLIRSAVDTAGNRESRHRLHVRIP
jgi:hypothetical protein